MTALQIIYTISTCIALLASFPQILQLITSKRSDELSVTTWLLWLCTQFVSLAYVVSIKDILLITFASVWLLFYAVMIGLILYYRRKPELVVVADKEESLMGDVKQ